MSSNKTPKSINDAMQAIQIVEEISNLLETGLDKETLTICVRLIENGVNPNSLAHIVQQIRNNSNKLSSINNIE